MQAVKYKWVIDKSTAEPFLIVRNSDTFDRVKLFGNELSMKVKQKRCIGYYQSGKQYECPQQRLLETGWYCNECKLNDDYALCMQCTGAECINLKQRQECSETIYYIYLAAFSNILKVGISLERRIMERLIEQGADLGALIALVKDGKDVRSIEQQIARELGVVDRIRGAQKHELIFGNPNHAAINIFNAIKKLRENGFGSSIRNHIIEPEIYDLRHYYRLHNVLGSTQKITVSDDCEIAGNVVAAKGNIMILENQGSFYSLNSHDLIGREIIANPIENKVIYSGSK